MDAGGAAAGRVHGGRQGRRDCRQRQLSGGVPARQSPDRDQRHARRLRERRREAALSRLVVHLSQACAAADRRECAPVRPPRADQRVVRDRQDRRHQAGPGLSPPIRVRFHCGDANQPLRARRQLRSRDEPCRPGAPPQGA